MAYAGESSVSSPLTSSTTRTHTTPTTPPINPDLSRTRIKKIARWIRDELDLLVAREGPNVLRPDDVLTLHEAFIALRHAQNITVSDLRATGIHKAVQDVAGVATRWPGRLCDDCDMIIDIWTTKFGRFGDIHPFLYGRGGRLEGIASTNEYSRESLLKRWARTCPEQIHPRRSHKSGNLGFRAGAWWINPLFAHHAGIIGLEACEGGTTYDKHGAYALLLKDTGEIEASSEDRFTYRVPQNDKGKYRLTSGTPKSRDPIRILRSHSINSFWGPKAGVRYEGLYSVKSWSIKQAKSTDLTGGHWKEGDILFDVRFERTDPIPMEAVTKRPTATEVDDYQEYKRLRRASRDIRQKRISAPPIRTDFEATVKAAPPIVPSQPTPLVLKPTQADVTPNTPRRGIFKHLHFDKEAYIHVHNRDEVVSPRTVPNNDPLITAPTTVIRSGTLAVPAPSNRTTTTNARIDNASPSESHTHPSPVGSNASSAQTATSAVPDIKIREVAPWIDYDANLTMPSPSGKPPIIHQRRVIAQASATFSPKTLETAKSLKARSHDIFLEPAAVVASSSVDAETSTNGESKSVLGDSLATTSTIRIGKRKSVLGRGRNPTVKLFDGVVDDGDEAKKGTWSRCSGPKIRRDGGGDVFEEKELLRSLLLPVYYGPTPVRPLSPDVPFIMARRNAIRPANEMVTQDVVFACIQYGDDDDDPLIQMSAPGPGRPKYIPNAMKKLISRPRAAKPLGSRICTATHVFGQEGSSAVAGTANWYGEQESLAEQRLKKLIVQQPKGGK